MNLFANRNRFTAIGKKKKKIYGCQSGESGRKDKLGVWD